MDIVTQNFGWLVLLAVGLFIFLYKRITKDPNAITSKYVQTHTLHNQDNVQRKIIESLKRSGFEAVNYDVVESKFYARTNFTMSSWGENITIEINIANNSVTSEFISICAFPFQIFDWGKNKRNYKRFYKELNKLSG